MCVYIHKVDDMLLPAPILRATVVFEKFSFCGIGLTLFSSSFFLSYAYSGSSSMDIFELS